MSQDQVKDPESHMLVMLARMEERFVALNNKHEDLVTKFEKLEQQATNLNMTVQENTRVILTISRLFWVIVVAIATTLAAQFLG